MSRPQHRTPTHHALLARITEACAAVGGQHGIYGQDQPAGFLEGAKKRAFLAGSSCYAAFSLPSGGFGLSEHEAMAAGVPVVTWAWGDMEKEAPNHPGLCFSPQEVALKAARCCTDRGFAEEVSAAGLEYTRKWRTLDRLSASVRGFLG